MNCREIGTPQLTRDAQSKNPKIPGISSILRQHGPKAISETDTEAKTGTSSALPTSSDDTSLSSADLRVIRQESRGVSSSTRHKISPLVDTHIGSTSSDTGRLEVSAAYLPDTRISTISIDSDSGYDRVLWPDVIDPYHTAKDLELKISKKAVTVHSQS